MRIDFNFISDIPILVAMQYFSTLTLDVLFVLLCIYFSLLTYLLLSLMSAFPYFILMELLILTKCNFLFLHRNIIALQNKNSLMTYAASADSDQPAHSCSLIRVHTSHLNLKHSVCKSQSRMQLDAHPAGEQEVVSLVPARSGNSLSWRLIMKYYLESFSPFY